MNYAIYQDECKRILDIIGKYQNTYQEFFNTKCQEVVREEFCIGGELLHRGYYCPSIIYDVVTGNAKRGRLVKKQPVKATEYFRYGFDKDGNLIIVIRPFCKEFIIREGDIELGVTFTDDWGIESISECIYEDGKLKSYGYYHHYTKYMNYEKEIYTYSNDNMVVNCITFMDGTVPLFQCSEYKFELCKDFLSTYTVDGKIYEVAIKRKV